ncbi:DUF411 domain-containing protein [Sphaerotilus microaerophilus]|uniref:Metal-binding protein n=1 Tax=Sphaerotilus microaerophilus TaxID=2914710 RepID=A0ABN6PVT8_9BURK|nr:DUF411 domain-containing protein [Sphaerotilus sp. FB-5]BDI07692.1 hypothetical protein CATMQ487_46620 [Sphaerotilus sp. FB-5]
MPAITPLALRITPRTAPGVIHRIGRPLAPLLLAGAAAVLGLGLGSLTAHAQPATASAAASAAPSGISPRADLPPVTVYAPSPCLACIDWADHLRRHGFTVTMEDKPQAEMPRIKRWLNVPSDLESVHTARVGPYFIEGHVPADDILALLKEQPKARGLAVPGLPRGAPGRESYNPICDTACTILDNAAAEPTVRREAYVTLLVGRDGRGKVWARH